MADRKASSVQGQSGMGAAGGATFGNFHQYYRFNQASERIQRLPRHVFAKALSHPVTAQRKLQLHDALLRKEEDALDKSRPFYKRKWFKFLVYRIAIR